MERQFANGALHCPYKGAADQAAAAGAAFIETSLLTRELPRLERELSAKLLTCKCRPSFLSASVYSARKQILGQMQSETLGWGFYVRFRKQIAMSDAVRDTGLGFLVRFRKQTTRSDAVRDTGLGFLVRFSDAALHEGVGAHT